MVDNADVSLVARLRVTRIYDLRGTRGIAFYWWGAANPPEALVQFIVESPTGFWLSKFYDGPARWRYVCIPWGSFVWVSSPQRFLEPHHYGFEEPDKSQIIGFLWTVYTPGLRRIDYIHAPVGERLPAEFIVRHADSEELKAGFDGQVTEDLLGEFIVKFSAYANLPSEFIAKQETSEQLLGKFIAKHTSSQELKAAFDSQV